MPVSAFRSMLPLTICAMALAQDPGAPVETPPSSSGGPASQGVSLPPPPDNVQPKFELVEGSDARQLADKYVTDQKWTAGWDLDKRWGVWIGSSSLTAEDATGLAVALNGAQLDAKFQFAEYLASVISTAATSMLEKNPGQIKAERDRMDARARLEGGDPVASAVRDLLDSGGATAADAGVERRSRISTASLTAAQAAIPGMMVAQTFVKTGPDGKNGTIAIVMLSTPKSRMIANAMLQGDPIPRVAPDPARTLRKFVDSLSPEALVYGSGATYRVNEAGELCALGFGVGSVDGDDPDDLRLAEQEATQAANAELRNVAGELVLGRRLLSRIAERTKWADGRQAAESRKQVQLTVGTLARALGMPGITTVAQKRFRSKMLGDLVCVVRCWNLSSAQAAADLRKAFEEQGGWKGGPGVQPGSGAGNGSTPTPRPEGGVPSGQGGAGIDEP